MKMPLESFNLEESKQNIVSQYAIIDPQHMRTKLARNIYLINMMLGFIYKIPFSVTRATNPKA